MAKRLIHHWFKYYILFFVKHLLLILFPVFLLAQKNEEKVISIHLLNNRKCNSSFTPVKLGGESVELIQSKLFEVIPALKERNSTLVFDYLQESPGGKHYSFHQKAKGLEVYQSQIKVNTDGKGLMLSFFDNSVHEATFEFEKLKPIDLLSHIKNFIGERKLATQKEQWVLTNENNLSNAYVLEVEGASGGWHEVIADNQNILYERDMNMYFAAPDTTVKGFVFLPDPLTTAGKTYGGIYVDNFDSNATWLTDERKQVNFVADFDAGTFRLRNSFVRIADYDLPTTSITTNNLPEFFYTRNQSGFEDVSIMYHISEIGKYVKQMGFNCANNLIEADGHAANGQDNSYFAFNYNPTRLYFGTGGVDDAEDGDVCVHEYSHFLSYSAAPNSNVGSQREALDEAFCDYNAASYSRAINNFNWGWVYNWDGHNQFWNGRVVNSSKIYPTNLGSSIYRNGEIWSSMLMQLWSDLGKQVTDKLIFQTHYGYAQNIDFLAAANLLLQADQQLYNGIHYCPITQRLNERGLLPAGKTLCPNGIDESGKELPVYLIRKLDGISITSSETLWNTSVEIFDASGKQIYSSSLNDGNIFIATSTFAKGIYLLRVADKQRSKVIKWVN